MTPAKVGFAAARGTVGGMAPLRILVVDDHDVVHWGFRLMLGRQPWVARCDGATTSAQAIELARKVRPDVALIDLFLGDESGAELCERLAAEMPDLGVLLMSGSGRLSAAAGRAVGAHGFISKSWTAGELEAAVRMAARGVTLYESEPDASPAEAALSARERDVLAHISRGATNREIAKALHLSPHTVKDHTSSLYRKLGVRNRAEAVQVAGG
jgi:two-component system response regulator DesR